MLYFGQSAAAENGRKEPGERAGSGRRWMGMKSVTENEADKLRREEKEHFIECLPAGFLRCTKAGAIDYASQGILADRKSTRLNSSHRL